MKKLIPFILGRYINLMSILRPAYASSFGFRLFCFPFRSALKPYQNQFLDTAEKSTIQHKGIDICVYRWHSGPKKVLFLHGWQSHSFRWKNYIEAFPAEEYSLYALDAPGHGRSGGNFLTVPLYSEVIEKFFHQYGDVDAIVSHSLGSFTTLYTLYRLPLLPVQKLVLLASPGEATEFISFYRKTLKLSNRAIEGIVDHFRNVIEEDVEFFSAPKFAASVNRPALIVHDEEDVETSHEHSINIHRSLKRSRLHLTKGLAHNLKSKEIIDKVSSFVKEPHTYDEVVSVR